MARTLMRARLLLLPVALLFAVAPLCAQRVHGQVIVAPAHGSGFRMGGGFGFGFNSITPLYSAPFYGGCGFGYGGFGYPAFGSIGPSVPFPQTIHYNVGYVGPTNDWRHWSPVRLIVEVAERDTRVIGMGVPQWAMRTEPLGDVARRERILAAQRRAERAGRELVLQARAR